jgi:hypothetical protein
MASSVQSSPQLAPAAGDWSARNLLLLSLLTVAAFLLMGYHPGAEDDAFYLAAIKSHLNPSLFPHDADFFRLQFQATIFDKLIALSVRLTHLPLAWTALLWQFAGLFFFLHGCWRISRRCFTEPPARWAAVTMIAALFTLPITGTGINLADQYLHPRTLATALILAAIVAVLDRRLWLTGILLAIAFSIHAIMASFGISFCAFLWWSLRSRPEFRPVPVGAALLIPLSWVFEPGSDAWRKAAATRSFYFVAQWEWYEWLGVFAPIVLLYAYRVWMTRRFEHRADTGHTIRVSVPEVSAQLPLVKALVYYSLFQTIVGLAIMLPVSLERLRPFEPMRYLNLVYLFFFLIVGGLFGKYVLRRHVYRWLLLFVPLSAGMFIAQRQLFAATEHLELPGRSLRNSWVQAFAWVRENTPVDSLFALDPHYIELPGEDYHGFRGLAERSALADWVKDGGMAARVPRLAPRWLKEVTAETGWQKFQGADIERLKKEFGVNWIILSKNDAIVSNAGGFGSVIVDPMTLITGEVPGMTCPYHNEQILVCRLY